MNWESESYLLSKRKFRENANIINVFTPHKGKVGGIVYGGNSRKIRNYLQISNKIFVINNTKNDNKIGYFKTELIKPIAPMFFNDKKRTSAITSLCSLLNSLLPEEQPNKTIYQLFENFINFINKDNWIFYYIFFEINLIKELGYDTNLHSFSKKLNLDVFQLQKIKIDENIYDVPVFLINQIIPDEMNDLLIKKSLEFTRNILFNKFFSLNNLVFPNSRIILERYFN